MMRRQILPVFAILSVIAACSGAGEDTSASSDDALSGCHGHAATSQPPNGMYYLTTFGGPGEGQHMSCGQYTHNGNWYYAASRQRFGCGAHIRIETNGKCVVAETDDYGPDSCVENRAGRPIIDASPMVAKALFGVSGAGWSDRRSIKVTKVSTSTKLGPCVATSTPTPPQAPPPDDNTDDGADTGGDDTGDDAGPGGAPCSNDGDCNPGTDGSGMICTGGECVPGCHHSYQCPGSSTCVGGQCR